MAAHASRISTDTLEGSAQPAAGSIFASMNRGASEIQTRVSEALPATSRFFGRAVYRTSYALSFGVALPVMMVVRVMPKNNAMVHGLVDGAMAARDRVHEWRGESIPSDFHESETETDHASGNGSAHPTRAHSTDHPTRRRTRAKRTGTTASPRKSTKSSSRKKS